MWETVHTLLYLDNDGTVVVDQVCAVVDFDKIVREVTEFHAHEFQLVHWCIETEIFQINGAVACFLC